jgi:hypothetical protein
VRLHQDERLLDEFMELVHPGKRVDARDAKDLFETRRKVGRSDVHLPHQSIDPPKAGIIEAVQPHEHQQDVLLDGTKGTRSGG